MGKFTNTWNINITLLSNHGIKEDIKRNIKNKQKWKYGNTIFQVLWDIAKAVLKGKCIAVNVYLKKKE